MWRGACTWRRWSVAERDGTRRPRSIGVRFPLDLVFYDRRRVVVGVVRALQSWRLSPLCLGAVGLIELPEGTVEASHPALGDQLEFR